MDMGGAPPHADNLIRSAAGGRRPNRTVEKMTRERRALSLLFPLATLGCSWTRRAQRAQGWPGSRPARLSQPNQPSEGGLRLCQSRNGATKSRIVRRAFPVTSRDSEASHLKSPHENDRRSPSWTRDARNKELNSRGKTKQLQTCLKPIQASTNWIFILTKLVNSIWMQ